MPRILVVEDDAELLDLTREILGEAGEVHCASKASEALRFIVGADYDLLITDLNIEHAGDGLLLAGAMRALHPAARNILITGYPDYTGSLAAFQAALDGVVLKPVDVATLRGLAKKPGNIIRPRDGMGRRSLWDLLAQEQRRILDGWLQLVAADRLLSSAPLSAEERLDDMTAIMGALSRGPEPGAGAEERAGAERHGRQRKFQYPSAHWISLEISYLRRVIFDAVLRKLLEMDLSRFPQDLFEMNLRIDADMLESLRTFGLK